MANTSYIGNAKKVLQILPDKSLNCITTSPPYWRLRDYGTGKWIGGDAACQHVPHKIKTKKQGNPAFNEGRPSRDKTLLAGEYQKVCSLCGATWFDEQIGLEQTPRQFIESLLEVFKECYRVLNDDGTMWVNIGDTYNSYPANVTKGGKLSGVNQHARHFTEPGYGLMEKSLKPKDLIGLPWMLAFALRDELGFYLRQDIIWNKPSPMPECLSPNTQVFIRKNAWVSRVTLGQIVDMDELPEIMTPTGWKRIEKLWKTVKPAISIEAGKVERVICSPDHQFPISSDRRRVKTRNEKAINIRHEGYADYFLYSPIVRFLSPSINEWMGRSLDYNLGYLIGSYVAEGGQKERCFEIKLTIHKNEDWFYKNIASCCDKFHIDIRNVQPEGTNYMEIFICEKWFYDTICSFVSGNVKNKQLNIELLLNTPEKFREGILNGYIDGDGTDRQGQGWSATSASRRLRDDIATLASSLGIITSKGQTIQNDKRTGKTYTGHTIWTPYKSRRKTKTNTEGIYQVPPRRRKQLNKEMEMIDIQVEGELFLIGDGLVSHNSVQDRCTKAHEYIFLFSKKKKYFYDAFAIATEPLDPARELRGISDQHRNINGAPGQPKHSITQPRLNVRKGELNGMAADYAINGTGLKGHSGNYDAQGNVIGTGKANKKSVWTISSTPYKGIHYAVFPAELAEPMIKAGTSEHGCCAMCGKQYIRILEKKLVRTKKGCHVFNVTERDLIADANDQGSNRTKDGHKPGWINEMVTTGWQKPCKCPTDEIKPAVVLDPFGGSGTTAIVANKLHRNSILIDLNEKYVREDQQKRLHAEIGLFNANTIIKLND